MFLFYFTAQNTFLSLGKTPFYLQPFRLKIVSGNGKHGKGRYPAESSKRALLFSLIVVYPLKLTRIETNYFSLSASKLFNILPAPIKIQNASTNKFLYEKNSFL